MAKFFLIGEVGDGGVWLVDVESKSVQRIEEADLANSDVPEGDIVLNSTRPAWSRTIRSTAASISRSPPRAAWDRRRTIAGKCTPDSRPGRRCGRAAAKRFSGRGSPAIGERPLRRRQSARPRRRSRALVRRGGGGGAIRGASPRHHAHGAGHGLDRIGIPVWTATRPNALSLSVSQGKGADDDAALASAVFEAAELAVAERRHPGAFQATPAGLAASGWKTMGGARFLRRGEAEPAPGEPLSWVEGVELLSGDAIAIPEDIVRLADVPGCRYWQTSDGLGTGSNLHEAAIHGICELIERDAMALWSLRSDSAVADHELAASALGSPAIDAVEKKIAAAGLRLRLFDITSNIRVPAFLAIIVPDLAPADLAYFDVASGSGAHPVAPRAALRAITEAAQTRLTTITGSRDDVDPEDYRRSLPTILRCMAKPPPMRRDGGLRKATPPREACPAISRGWSRGVKAAGVRTLALAPFEAPDFPFVVARAVSPDLEHDPRSGNRRPGRRLLAAMLAGP